MSGVRTVPERRTPRQTPDSQDSSQPASGQRQHRRCIWVWGWGVWAGLGEGRREGGGGERVGVWPGWHTHEVRLGGDGEEKDPRSGGPGAFQLGRLSELLWFLRWRVLGSGGLGGSQKPRQPCPPWPEARQWAARVGRWARGFARSCSGICPELGPRGTPCLPWGGSQSVPGLTSVIHVLAKTVVPWACSGPDSSSTARLGETGFIR